MDGRLFNFFHTGSGLGKQVLPSKLTAGGFVEISQRNRGGGNTGRDTGQTFTQVAGHVTTYAAPAGLAQVEAVKL